MGPYYDQDGITIWHGDCREVLPTLPSASVDLVLTDPPYPDMKGGTIYTHGVLAPAMNASTTVGTPWGIALDAWLPEAWRVADLGLMTFCSFHSVPEVAALVPKETRVALLTWHKRNAPPAQANVPHFTTEFIWLFKKRPGLKWRALQTLIDIPNIVGGCVKTERFTEPSGQVTHPSQKPERLMRVLLSVGGATVLDPFMGTGTTLVAAKQLGRRCVGIELDERYCEIAAKRLMQSVMTLEGAAS